MTRSVIKNIRTMKPMTKRFSLVSGCSGLTLVEVMVSVVVLVTVLLGVLSAVVQTYRTNEVVRRRDQVRAILQSYANDFMSDAVRDASTKSVKTFFQMSIAPTGTGLTWTDSSGTITTGTTDNLKINLGGLNAPEVVITRWVRGIDETNTKGTPDLSIAEKSAAGREIVGEFKATFKVHRRTQVITLYVVRADV